MRGIEPETLGELLDEAAVGDALARSLHDRSQREALRAHAVEFVELAAKLPSCLELFDSHLR